MKRFRFVDPAEPVNQVLSDDWRPEPGDLCVTDLRAIASLKVGECHWLGGGAAPEVYIRRTR